MTNEKNELQELPLWAQLLIFVFGLLLSLWPLYQLNLAIQQWQNSPSLLWLVMEMLVWLFVVSLVVLVTLLPFQNIKPVEYILKALMWPLGVVYVLGYIPSIILAPFFAFFFTSYLIVGVLLYVPI